MFVYQRVRLISMFFSFTWIQPCCCFCFFCESHLCVFFFAFGKKNQVIFLSPNVGLVTFTTIEFGVFCGFHHPNKWSPSPRLQALLQQGEGCAAFGNAAFLEAAVEVTNRSVEFSIPQKNRRSGRSYSKVHKN